MFFYCLQSIRVLSLENRHVLRKKNFPSMKTICIFYNHMAETLLIYFRKFFEWTYLPILINELSFLWLCICDTNISWLGFKKNRWAKRVGQSSVSWVLVCSSWEITFFNYAVRSAGSVIIRSGAIFHWIWHLSLNLNLT